MKILEHSSDNYAVIRLYSNEAEQHLDDAYNTFCKVIDHCRESDVAEIEAFSERILELKYELKELRRKLT